MMDGLLKDSCVVPPYPAANHSSLREMEFALFGPYPGQTPVLRVLPITEMTSGCPVPLWDQPCLEMIHRLS